MKRAALIWIFTAILNFTVSGQVQPIQPDLSKYSVSLINGYITQIPVDTIISGSQITHPLYKRFPGWSEMGNSGLPALPLKYTGPGKTNTPFFLIPYQSYFEGDEKINFYDTKTPFSQISYAGEITGDKNKVTQELNFFYSRNIRPDINITGLFDYNSSNGDYTNQSTTLSNLGITLEIEKRRYKHYSKLERIQFKLQENGGVVNDEEVISSSGRFTALVDVNLQNAASQTNLLRLFGRQHFDVFSSAVNVPDSLFEKPAKRFRPVLIHNYNYSSARRLFIDEPLSMEFYPDTLINGESTRDSVQSFSFENDFSLLFEISPADSLKWMLETGLHHELLHFYSYEDSRWVQGLGARAFTSIDLKRMRITGNGNLIFAGYAAGDHSIEINAGLSRYGNFTGPVISLSSKAYTPDLFIDRYSSNHFRWENNFRKQIEQSAGLGWDIPKVKLNLELSARLVTNWIFFDQNALPSQRANTAAVFSSAVLKDFSAGPFRSRNRICLNYSTAEEIPLPLFVASTSTFMHHDIHFEKTGGLLQLEYGLDLRYASTYEGYAYMPATGVFHLQNERMLGNYPFLDLFIMMRVKRTRFFVKWNHVNSGFTGSNIFPVLHYPVKERHISYGVYWHFYD